MATFKYKAWVILLDKLLEIELSFLNSVQFTSPLFTECLYLQGWGYKDDWTLTTALTEFSWVCDNRMQQSETTEERAILFFSRHQGLWDCAWTCF